jgi:glycosyltransferase involved in cell wall biosynthesis
VNVPPLATLDRLPPPPPGRSGWPWTEAPKPLALRRAGGSPWPRITIVTPSHNQGDYLEETLRSVLLQGYPNLEYIVIDGGSSDHSLQVIARYAPWLARWEAQPDRGQAGALNSGFAQATGAILGYLNSDDTYLPGALECAAREVDVQRNRHLVIGRCLFVDAAGTPLGSEHPSRAVSHRRLLAVWKGHTVPQPASFWSRAAWTAGGPLIEDAGMPWIDYGLFCRMTRRYRLHAVDQLLATYRLHPTSITVTTGATGANSASEQVLAVSRCYWGPPWTPRHLLLAASLALHRLDRLGRGRAILRRALAQRAQGEKRRARGLTALAALVAPDLLCRLAIERRQAHGRQHPLAPALASLAGRRAEPLHERKKPWPDRWVGPRLQLELEAAGGEQRLRIEGIAARSYLGAPLALKVWIDGCRASAATLDREGPFAVELPMTPTAAPGRRRVEIEATPYFIPDTILGNGDQRALCWLLHAVTLQP